MGRRMAGGRPLTCVDDDADEQQECWLEDGTASAVSPATLQRRRRTDADVHDAEVLQSTKKHHYLLT